jgi:hypothetical protein
MIKAYIKRWYWSLTNIRREIEGIRKEELRTLKRLEKYG